MVKKLEQTFRNLTGIIVKDTSKLQGPDKDKAETNKMIGMWTLAVLQKDIRDAMDSNPECKNKALR